MYVFDWLKVRLGRLELEAVALLQGDLEMLFVACSAREGLALRYLLVGKESSRHEFSVVTLVGECR